MDRIKTITALKKLFKERDAVTTEIPEAEQKLLMDGSATCAIVPKTKEFDKLFKEAYDATESNTEMKELKEEGSTWECKVKLSVEYFVRLIEILKAGGYETIVLRTGTDKPVRIDTEDFAFILAPRIDTE